ncbi:MAG: hypothetical protein QXW94_07115 [Desulfurococcaceae archaeon]
MNDQFVIEMKRAFLEELRSLIKAGLLTEKDLLRCTKTNTHAYLVHCALEAGRRADYLAIPDYKIRFKSGYCLPGRNKPRRFAKVDVAYFSKGNWRLKGVAECFTVDEADHALESTVDGKEPRDRERLMHLIGRRDDILSARESEIKFVLIITVLPRKVKEKPYWTDELKKAPRDFYSQFKGSWEDLVNQLSKAGCRAELLVITEETIKS